MGVGMDMSEDDGHLGVKYRYVCERGDRMMAW